MSTTIIQNPSYSDVRPGDVVTIRISTDVWENEGTVITSPVLSLVGAGFRLQFTFDQLGVSRGTMAMDHRFYAASNIADLIRIVRIDDESNSVDRAEQALKDAGVEVTDRIREALKADLPDPAAATTFVLAEVNYAQDDIRDGDIVCLRESETKEYVVDSIHFQLDDPDPQFDHTGDEQGGQFAKNYGGHRYWIFDGENDYMRVFRPVRLSARAKRLLDLAEAHPSLALTDSEKTAIADILA